MKRSGAVFRVESRTRAVGDTATRALERALNRVAVHWHGEARQRAPVDTGRLQSSIAFSAPGESPAAVLQGTPPGVFVPPPARGLEAMVGSNVEYAAAVHELHPDASKREFIEGPGNENADHYQRIIRDEVTNATTGGRAAADD